MAQLVSGIISSGLSASLFRACKKAFKHNGVAQEKQKRIITMIMVYILLIIVYVAEMV
jgi:hypothetical protein